MAFDVPSGWSDEGGALAKTFDRGSFNGEIAFANAVAAVAERLDHDPDITVSWKEVTIRTWSHDVNAITERDAALARAIDAL